MIIGQTKSTPWIINYNEQICTLHNSNLYIKLSCFLQYRRNFRLNKYLLQRERTYSKY